MDDSVSCVAKGLKEKQEELAMNLTMAILLCNSALGPLQLPYLTVIFILSFLKSNRRAITRANKQIAKEYEEQKIAGFIEKTPKRRHLNPDIPTHYFQLKMNELNAKCIIETHKEFYAYALTVAPDFIKTTLINVCKDGKPDLHTRMRRADALHRKQILVLLSVLLHIFSDGKFTDKYPSHKEIDRTRDGSKLKEKITSPNYFYVKVGAIKSLISIFNSSILRSFNIPELKHTYTYIDINGCNTIIPIPMTLEIYLGLVSKQLQKL